MGVEEGPARQGGREGASTGEVCVHARVRTGEFAGVRV